MVSDGIQRAGGRTRIGWPCSSSAICPCWSRTPTAFGSKLYGARQFAATWRLVRMKPSLVTTNPEPLPVTAIVDQFYGRLQQRGGGRWDTSSLIRLLRDPK